MSRTIWSTANEAFSDAERTEFNQWMGILWVRGDKARDEARAGGGDLSGINDLMHAISNIPFMVGEHDEF